MNQKIQELITSELEGVEGLPHSQFECYAMLMCGVEDVDEHASQLKERMCDLWEAVRQSNDNDSRNYARMVEESAARLIDDAVGVAVMARKFRAIGDETDTEPAQLGRWEETNDWDEWYARVYKCSLCGETSLGGLDKYCAGCGARMGVQPDA